MTFRLAKRDRGIALIIVMIIVVITTTVIVMLPHRPTNLAPVKSALELRGIAHR